MPQIKASSLVQYIIVVSIDKVVIEQENTQVDATNSVGLRDIPTVSLQNINQAITPVFFPHLIVVDCNFFGELTIQVLLLANISKASIPRLCFTQQLLIAT